MAAETVVRAAKPQLNLCVCQPMPANATQRPPTGAGVCGRLSTLRRCPGAAMDHALAMVDRVGKDNINDSDNRDDRQ